MTTVLPPIEIFKPDMPGYKELEPWLKRIDVNQYYTNFGPLYHEFSDSLKPLLIKSSNQPAHIALTASGTDALILSLLALNLPEKSHVLVPAYTFVATALAVIQAGLTPVFCDVDENSWCLTPSIALAALNTIQAKAVIPVCAFGHPVNANAWDQFYEATGCSVVIDAAPAIGNQAIAQHALTCFSLHATKCLGVGEGGFVASHNKELINTIKSFSNFALKNNICTHRSFNSKLSEYHAAVGLAQCLRFKDIKTKNIIVRQYYKKQLESLNTITQENFDCYINNNMPIRFSSEHHKAQFCNTMKSNNIAYRHYYAPLLNQHPALVNSLCLDLQFSESLAASVVCLPMHNHLSFDSIDRIMQLLQHHLETH